MKKEYALCWSGSGDQFATQIGTWNYLYEFIKPTKQIATSGGSIIASMIAMDFSLYQINRVLKDIQINELLDTYWTSPISLIQKDKLALIKGDKLLQKLKEIFPYKLSETKTPLSITATDIKQEKLKIFGTIETPDIYIYDAIRASISLPMIFKPHIIEGIEYCDGGLCENFYLKYLKDESNVIGIRCVESDKIKNIPVESIQQMITKTIFIPILRNEEKNIEDCPQAIIFPLQTESDNYDFKKLTYEHLLKQVQYGKSEASIFFQNKL